MSRRGTRVGRTFGAAVVGAILVACGPQVQDIDPQSLPPGLLAAGPSQSAAPSPLDRTAGRVYFLDGDRLTPSPRAIATGPPAAALPTLLGDLTVGPTEADRRAGLSSALPPGSTVVLVRISDGVAVIDLRVIQPPPEQTTLLAQIVLSATTVPGVDAVLLTLNGKRINAPLANGAQTGRPLTRQDYLGLLEHPEDSG